MNLVNCSSRTARGGAVVARGSLSLRVTSVDAFLVRARRFSLCKGVYARNGANTVLTLCNAYASAVRSGGNDWRRRKPRASIERCR